MKRQAAAAKKEGFLKASDKLRLINGKKENHADR